MNARFLSKSGTISQVRLVDDYYYFLFKFFRLKLPKIIIHFWNSNGDALSRLYAHPTEVILQKHGQQSFYKYTDTCLIGKNDKKRTKRKDLEDSCVKERLLEHRFCFIN